MRTTLVLREVDAPRYTPASAAGLIESVRGDCYAMPVGRPGRTPQQFLYLAHIIRPKPEIPVLPEGHQGWLPNRCSAVGIIFLRMDYQGSSILGRDVNRLTHRGWVAVFDELRVLANAFDVLQLPPDVRSLAEWDVRFHYFFRHKWLKRHSEWVRIHEENPGLRTVTFRLSEVVAAHEARQ